MQPPPDLFRDPAAAVLLSAVAAPSSSEVRPLPLLLFPDMVAGSSVVVARSLLHTFSSIRDLQGDKTDEAAEARDWLNLPDDLLESIIRLLPNFVDRFHLGCACKSWLSVARATPRPNYLPFGSPCLFILQREGESCCLLDPLYKDDKYTIDTPDLPSPVKILACKGGWLLMLANDGKSIFFFNPLTKATISLPKTEEACFSSFSFSHIPTSPFCVVIAILFDRDDSCRISVCRRGAKDWSEMDYYDNNIEFMLSHTTPIFHKGCFYCLGDNGRLGVFDHVENTWTVLEKPEKSRSLTHRLYLTELDGELIWVRSNLTGDSIHICKLDPLRNRWIELDSLGDSSLFVSKVASICLKPAMVGTGRNGVYFGMIQDGDFVFYSCEARRLHPRRDFDSAKDYFYTSCWIEPVFDQPSAEELQWIEL